MVNNNLLSLSLSLILKLFYFKLETHEGVQDMACDTFIKIAQKCRRHFVQTQVGENIPFIEEILNNINTIICDLEPHQVHTFYEAVGHMISAQTDNGAQEALIEKYMHLPNIVWDSIIQQATVDYNVLKDPEIVKQLGNILKTNVRACKSLGNPYIIQVIINFLTHFKTNFLFLTVRTCLFRHVECL
jgi:exportin-1